MKGNFLFDAWPYITAALLLMGILARYLLISNITVIDADMLPTMPASPRSVIWQTSLVASLAFHLLFLAFPTAMLSWSSNPARLYVAESFALVTGVLALAGCARLMWVQLRGSAPAIFEICGTAFYALLLLVLLSGCLIVILHRWGSSWAALTLSPYLISLLRGQPVSVLVTQMPFLVRLHVFCAFAAIAAFPFTRPAGAVVALVRYLLDLADATFAGVVRVAESWLHQYDPAPWLWPEED
jgi:nitrate reductase gamma subunit